MHSELIQALFESLNQLGNQAKLAEAIGASQGTVSRWLRNTHGMEVGYCLKFAKITARDPAQVLRWAGHDPADYLPSVLVMSEEAQEIQARIRLLDWHKRRERVPTELQSLADDMIVGILEVMRKTPPTPELSQEHGSGNGNGNGNGTSLHPPAAPRL